MISNNEHIDLLCYPSSTPSSVPGSQGVAIPSFNVAGMGHKGSLVAGPLFEPTQEYHWQRLTLSDEHTALFGRFFRRYLTQSAGQIVHGWNGHSFVAATMGWKTGWNVDRTPTNVTNTEPVELDGMQNGKPYAVLKAGRHSQSLIGLDDGLALCVAGYERPLKIMAGHVACATWGDTIAPLVSLDASERSDMATCDDITYARSYDIPHINAN